MIGVSIAIGFAFTVAMILSWPTPGGLLAAMFILATVSAAGGYIAAIVTRNETEQK